MSLDLSSNVFDSGTPKLLTERIDFYADNEPYRTFASIPVSPSDISQGFRDISYKALAQCIDRAAWWLDSVLGDDEESRTPIFYSGPDDIQYIAIIVAALKSRRLLFQCSYQSQDENLASMFDSCGCSVTISHSIEPGSIIDVVHKRRKGMKHVEAPCLNEWLEGPAVKRYLIVGTWAETYQKPVCVFHTSGTTSVPKLITYTNLRFANAGIYEEFKAHYPDVWHMSVHNRRLHFSPRLPHVAGVAAGLLMPVYSGSTAVLARPPDKDLLTPDFIAQVIHYGKVDSCFYMPGTLHAITEHPEALRAVQGIEQIVSGGAALPQRDIDKLTAGKNKPKIYTAIGSTECFPTAHLKPFSTEYYGFHPISGVRFEPVDGDNEVERSDGPKYYEMTIVKELQPPTCRTVFQSFPDVDIWRTGDLFTPHPTRDGYWAFAGRSDDMITLSTAQNVYAAPIESTVMKSPLVKSALLGQTGRPSTVLLIEPAAAVKEMDKAGLFEEIWPAVEEANVACKADAVIQKRMTILLDPDQSFVTTDKGSVSRKKTLDRFNTLIEAAFG